MSELNEQQRQRALEVFKEYSTAPSATAGKTFVQEDKELDEKRVDLIEASLKPLVAGYLSETVPLADFKSKIDGFNKRNEYWGFKGIKGQMFFNMVVNVADNREECDHELKAAIALPSNEQIAASRIKTFSSYVKRLGEQWGQAGNTGHGAPKVGSIPFFLSYFWQIQDRLTFPVYYTTNVQAMMDLNVWHPTGELADDYLIFKHIHEELKKLYSDSAGREITLYDIEHVFWYKGEQNPGGESAETSEKKAPKASVSEKPEQLDGLLPESYIPPIIAVLPQMARNEDMFNKAAQRSGTTLERAFEKHINAAFTMLCYDTKLLGQGKGRVPDGIAIANDDRYAILWDGKIRRDGYSMGTDDRTIREYITTQSRELKRLRTLRNIYYLIVSSKFADDFDDTIRSIKMETDVSEVVLVEATALVEIVDRKLRAPLQFGLGPDGLQRLFSTSGVLTIETVREFLI